VVSSAGVRRELEGFRPCQYWEGFPDVRLNAEAAENAEKRERKERAKKEETEKKNKASRKGAKKAGTWEKKQQQNHRFFYPRFILSWRLCASLSSSSSSALFPLSFLCVLRALRVQT
jgi:hypothetical protein